MGLLNQQNNKQAKKSNSKGKPQTSASKFIVKPNNPSQGFIKKTVNKSSNRGS